MLKVKKISRKPFKCGLQVVHVREVTVHPITQRPAYLIDEDGSTVETQKCEIIEDKVTE